MVGTKRYAVAASGQWTDEEEGRRRLPSGEMHAWEPGRDETVCGPSLSHARLVRFPHGRPAGPLPARSPGWSASRTVARLVRFPHVGWPDIFPESGGAADRVRRLCPRCASVAGRRGPDARPRWRRIDPRP